ncbi:MAG: hypothetical protein ABII76_11630 [Pseudomonadota bacterium]
MQYDPHVSGLQADLVLSVPGEPSDESGIGFPALVFDPAEYRKFVEDSDLTDAQQQELLGALWVIIVGFVDLGFHIHPVQQALDAREGDVNKTQVALAADSPPMVSCGHAFKQITSAKPARRRKAHAAGRKDS